MSAPWLTRLSRQLSSERLHTLRLLAMRQMPPQILGNAVEPAAAIPVFAEHAPGGEQFEKKLRHLADNGYETVDTRLFSEWLAGRWTPRRPAVMLTFDDGLRAFAERTLPLLRRYGLRSVLFVCPGLVELAGGDEGPLGRLARQTILTWDELNSIRADGDVDIQSHGMWHNKTPCCAKPTIERRGRPRTIMDQPDLLPPDGRLENLLEAPERDIVCHPSQPLFCAKGVARSVLVEDLAQAKAMIERRLGGAAVRALALPWWRGSGEALAAARQTGHELVFWGLAGVRGRLGRQAVDPMRIGRLGPDWIPCMAGRGRKTLASVLWEKLRGEVSDG